MTTPRRRIVRPAPPINPVQERQQQIERLRLGLTQARTALGRWQTRLKRAFTTTQKYQKTITRIEKHIARLEVSQP